MVWQAGNGWPTDLPVVELRDQLDAPVGELSHALGHAPTAQPPGTLGRCAAPLADLPTDDVHALLGQAAETRLRAKAGALAAVAARTDWRQALWEGLFTALGYKQNSWPMRRLTELLPDQLDRDRLAKSILPRDVWTFHGLRPDKRPVRRLCFFPDLVHRHSLEKR